MDSVSAANAASAASAASSTTSSKGTAKADDGKSFATLFAEAEKDLKKGEKLSKVDGHEYARIKGGTRDDQCINLSGNVRSGQAFDLIWRDGRQFHVYGGRGAQHTVVEVGHKAADTKAADTKAAASTTGGTDAAATTGTTSSTGDASSSDASASSS